MPAAAKTKDKPLPKQGYSPDLQKYFNKQVLIRLTGDRRIIGKIIGYDQFMNLCLDEAVEYLGDNNAEPRQLFKTLIRGKSIIFWECLDKVD